MEIAPIYQSDPAHIRLGTDGGMGKKPQDFWILPICPHHHREIQHRKLGERAFWGSNLELAKQTARKLHEAYDKGNYMPAIEVLERYREQIK